MYHFLHLRDLGISLIASRDEFVNSVAQELLFRIAKHMLIGTLVARKQGSLSSNCFGAVSEQDLAHRLMPIETYLPFFSLFSATGHLRFGGTPIDTASSAEVLSLGKATDFSPFLEEDPAVPLERTAGR